MSDIAYARHSAPKMGRAAKYKIPIANLRKNSGERLHVQLEEYNGQDLFSMIVKRDATGQHRMGKMKATQRSISIRIDQLGALIDALQDAKTKAVEIGVLADSQKGAA